MTRYKSKRSNATNVTYETRVKIIERDNRNCIFCGTGHGLTAAHYISRGQGGLGIEQNVASVCMRCHQLLDHSTNRHVMLKRFRMYLDRFYPDFTDFDRTYRKGMEYE